MLYRPETVSGEEDDGLHIQAVTTSLVRAAELAREFDTTHNMMLLLPLQSVLRNHRILVDRLERKVEALHRKEIKRNKRIIKKATAQLPYRSPFNRL